MIGHETLVCAERAWVVWFGRVWVVVCCARRIVIRPATAALSRCRRDAPWPVVSQVLLHPPPCALDCLGPCATGRGTWLPWPLHRAAACRPLRTCASKHRLTLSCRDNIIRRSCARPCGGGWTHNPPTSGVLGCACVPTCSYFVGPPSEAPLITLCGQTTPTVEELVVLAFFLLYGTACSDGCLVNAFWHHGLGGCTRV